jgi:hypothetical protein
MKKGDNAGQPRPHRGDPDPPVLLVLDEGFEVTPFNLLDFSLARLSIKAEEEHD